MWGVGRHYRSASMLARGIRLRGLERGKVAGGWGEVCVSRRGGYWGQRSLQSLTLRHGDRPPSLPHSLSSCLALTAGSMDASPAPCAPSTVWDVPWILMLLLTAGQGVTILVLSVMLWRQRAHGTQCKGESLPPRRRKTARGCEAEGWAHIIPLYPIFSRA